MRGSDSASSETASRPTQAGRGPVLDAAQLDVLRRYGGEHDVVVGDVLFADGDETYDLIVILDGQVDIVQHRGEPGQTVIATYGPGQFLGELGLLTGQRAYLSAVTGHRGCARAGRAGDDDDRMLS